jgi:hypothetical protein
MIAMLNLHSTLLGLAIGSRLIAGAAKTARREYLRRCRDRRVGQMVRMAVLSFEGVTAPSQTENLVWQAWETGTGGRGC